MTNSPLSQKFSTKTSYKTQASSNWFSKLHFWLKSRSGSHRCFANLTSAKEKTTDPSKATTNTKKSTRETQIMNITFINVNDVGRLASC